jgi:hypothetical protein
MNPNIVRRNYKKGKFAALRLAERDVTKQIRDYLELRGWRPVRMMSSVIPGAFRVGEKGMPDYLFLHYRRRVALWVEMKAPAGRLRPEQTAWIDAERRRGGLVAVVDDLDMFDAWYTGLFGREGQTRLFTEVAMTERTPEQ